MKKYANHDYKHLVGKDYPLYGIKTRVPKNKNPKFNRMSQLAALVALEIVNEGDGKANGEANIEIRNVSYEVKNENIVGGFKVDITGDEPSFASGTSPANKTTVTIVDDNDKDSFISIAPGKSAKIYFAVKPHDASGKSVTITVNGSSRTITMPANTKFKMGQATTIRVPVSLSYPKASDAVEGTSFFSWSNMAETNLCVNGETLKAYVVGKTGELGTMTLTATGKEIINALDVGFYASTWKGQRSAMTVSNIDVWFDKDNPDTQISKYQPLVDIIKTELADDITKKEYGLWGDEVPNWDLINMAVPIVLGVLDDGIPRDDTGLLSFIYLTKFIDPQTITFNGVIESSGSSETGQIIILDEGPIYKEIKSKTVDDLLAAKFSINNQTPKFEGILDIVNGNADSDNANLTASVLYNKLKDVIAGKGTLSMTVDLKITKISVDINLENVFNAIITSVDDLKTKLPMMKFEITISTCPYHPTKASYGSKAKPIALEDIPGDKNPIIFWGLDMYGPDSSEPQM